MHATHLKAESFRRMRWLNGAGWTREVHRQPAQSETFDWRASVAEIDVDSPFSPFPGCLRHQTLLQGNGFRLRFDDSEALLEPPHGKHCYPGEAAVSAALIDGPAHAFNLIWRPQSIEAKVLHRPLVGATLFFPEPGIRWLIYLMQGQASLQQPNGSILLGAGDALLLEPEAENVKAAERRLLDGGGEVLLCRLASVG